MAEGINKATQEMADAATGIETRSKVAELAQRESPLDEARRLNRETKEIMGELSKVKQDLTELAAFTALSGKSFAGVPKEITPEEQKQSNIDAYAASLIRHMPGYVK